MGGQYQTAHLPIEDQRLDSLRPRIEGNGKSLLRRPKLSTKRSSTPGEKKKLFREKRRKNCRFYT
jgi:hypothetical protein